MITENKNGNSDFAFVCETPLHLFNAINFVANDIENSKGNSDIYIYHVFNDSENISKNLRKAKLFNNVYDISRYNEDVDVFTRCRILFRLFFSKQTIKNHLDYAKFFNKKSYKYLVMYSFTMRNRNFVGTFSNADVIMIEDGIGAYHSNQMKDYIDGYYKLMDKYIFRGKYDCNPVRMYVYRPDICKNDITNNPLKMPAMDKKNPAFEIAHDVYSYKDTGEYKDKSIVYFTQPLNLLSIQFIDESDQKIIKFIDELGLSDKLITRIHPRQKDIEIFGSDYDTSNNFWELESAHSITDEHVLISAFSTAMFTPKYINNVEPYIIFTYKLSFVIEDTPYWNNLQRFFQLFIEVYDDKSKIAIPETFDEYREVLEKFTKAKGN